MKCLAAGVLVGLPVVFASDKDSYHLFKPVPLEQMREMATDRPDKTESPFTVDAGHFQIEADILNYSYTRRDPADQRVENLGIAPINLKAGLCNHADLQLVLQPYNSVRTVDIPSGMVTKQRGFGDVIARLKWNFWGNDGGTTALAAMPFVKLPTNQDQLGNNSVEGGIIFPLAVELPGGWGMGVMTELDAIRDGAGGDHHAEFINTITFSHDIWGKLAGFAEFFSNASLERGSDWIGTVDVGFTYALTRDIQLDAGINFGVTSAADDFNPFIGISFRF